MLSSFTRFAWEQLKTLYSQSPYGAAAVPFQVGLYNSVNATELSFLSIQIESDNSLCPQQVTNRSDSHGERLPLPWLRSEFFLPHLSSCQGSVCFFILYFGPLKSGINRNASFNMRAYSICLLSRKKCAAVWQTRGSDTDTTQTLVCCRVYLCLYAASQRHVVVKVCESFMRAYDAKTHVCVCWQLMAL